jgi:hypothetical protein
VREGGWDPDHHEDDHKSRNGLAARGYWQAFQKVKATVAEVIAGGNPGSLVRAVLGHRMFGYIHPYPDGNGRMARLLMNAMLASGGYPWTVIRVRDRKSYLGALDSASIDMDINPFCAFVAERVQWSLEHRDLSFPEQNEKFIFDRQVVAFWGQDGKNRVRCEISRAALDDDFKGDDKDKVELFRANRQAIEEEARQKYLAGDTERDGSILIRTGDLQH